MAFKSTKFLVLSDTHNFEHDGSQPYPLCQKMPTVDVVLHCGDLTQVGGTSAYKKALKMLGSFGAELKLVIAGNHDISLDGEYWRTHLEDDDEPEEHDEAVEIMTGPLAKAAKVTYLTEGLHSFTLRSGVSFSIFVSPYQPDFGDWAFGYPRNQNRWNIPSNADIVMTHGPPKGALDFGHNQHLGCEYLAKAVEATRPLMHCFGHVHEGYGAEVKTWSGENEKGDDLRQVTFTQAGTDDQGKTVAVAQGRTTLMVNAAIMNASNQPENAPWLVDLPLENNVTPETQQSIQHLIRQFVKDDRSLSENLIKETHQIMMHELGWDDAGVVSSKSLAGAYRVGNERAYIGGGHEFPKPSDIPKLMQNMVDTLRSDLTDAVQKDQLDPFALAAKYCDRFVNIHLFKDGNGRMCRLILNAILMKYAGIIISVGEKGENRQEYISIAVESRQVGGHSGQLASMVLHNAEETLKRWKDTLKYKSSRKNQ